MHSEPDYRELIERLGDMIYTLDLDGRFTHLYDLYEARIAAFEANPPPPDWSGIYVAESK